MVKTFRGGQLLQEFVISDFNISGITQKAIDKDGLGQVKLINATVFGQDLELLFEVGSSHNEPVHVDMHGKQNPNLKYGYAAVLRFLEMKKVIKEKPLGKGNIDAVFRKCDVQVHCDCPAFYWQGIHQDDSSNHTAKYKFQGKPGNHAWTMRHANAGGTTGQALCKHLYAVTEWLFKHEEDVMEKLQLKDEENSKRIVHTTKAGKRRKKLKVVQPLHEIQREDSMEYELDEGLADALKTVGKGAAGAVKKAGNKLLDIVPGGKVAKSIGKGAVDVIKQAAKEYKVKIVNPGKFPNIHKFFVEISGDSVYQQKLGYAVKEWNENSGKATNVNFEKTIVKDLNKLGPREKELYTFLSSNFDKRLKSDAKFKKEFVHLYNLKTDDEGVAPLRSIADKYNAEYSPKLAKRILIGRLYIPMKEKIINILRDNDGTEDSEASKIADDALGESVLKEKRIKTGLSFKGNVSSIKKSVNNIFAKVFRNSESVVLINEVKSTKQEFTIKVIGEKPFKVSILFSKRGYCIEPKNEKFDSFEGATTNEFDKDLEALMKDVYKVCKTKM